MTRWTNQVKILKGFPFFTPFLPRFHTIFVCLKKLICIWNSNRVVIYSWKQKDFVQTQENRNFFFVLLNKFLRFFWASREQCSFKKFMKRLINCHFSLSPKDQEASNTTAAQVSPLAGQMKTSHAIFSMIFFNTQNNPASLWSPTCGN